jgi:hypothetical protein
MPILVGHGPDLGALDADPGAHDAPSHDRVARAPSQEALGAVGSEPSVHCARPGGRSGRAAQRPAAASCGARPWRASARGVPTPSGSLRSRSKRSHLVPATSRNVGFARFVEMSGSGSFALRELSETTLPPPSAVVSVGNAQRCPRGCGQLPGPSASATRATVTGAPAMPAGAPRLGPLRKRGVMQETSVTQLPPGPLSAFRRGTGSDEGRPVL